MLSILFVGFLVLAAVGGQTAKPVTQKINTASILPVYIGPELSAQAYLVKIVGEDKVLLTQRAWKKLPPASLTKIMTSLVALRELNPFNRITFSRDSKNTEQIVSPTKAGESFTREDMVRLAIVGSANDAALALAEETGRSKGAQSFGESLMIFKDLMNQEAARLGMADTSFENPVGFDDPTHYTTAQDLARLAEYTWFNYPLIWEFSRSQEADVYSEVGNAYKMANSNNLLKEFPSILGTKTGTTDNAKEALVMFYPVRPDKTALVIILKSENRAEDGRKILQWLDGLDLNK